MTLGKTKNLGQIAAIWISSSAPENKKLIWYDNSERVHKVYETSNGGKWVAINPQVVTDITLERLSLIASTGLSIGKFYYLTDINALAIAITTTKIWYVDSFNNYVVNDLASTITSYINSNNLLIDGSTGVWNTTTGRLEFNFTEVESGGDLQIDDDYVVIRRKIGSAWSWVKTKLKNLISSTIGNSISWNNGFYFNFNNAINGIMNQIGGIVGYNLFRNTIGSEYFETGHSNIHTDIRNISSTIQTNVAVLKKYTDDATKDSEIYSKKLNKNWQIYQNPPQVPGSDSKLEDVISIILSWVNLLQNSSNIKIGNGFLPNGRSGNVNYNDNVKTAIEKLIYKAGILAISDGIKLPTNFNISDYSGSVEAEDTLTTAIGKFANIFSKLNDEIWAAKFRNGDWYEELTLGDSIGEFDSQGEPLYTATLEGAVYLLGLWYREHFNGFDSKNFQSLEISYRYLDPTSLWQEKTMVSRDVFEYKVTENSLIISSKSSILNYPLIYKQARDTGISDFYNVSGGNNASNIVIKLYESRVISLLLKKYGANRLFKTDIVFAAKANDQRSDGNIGGNNAAWGHYYACLINSENDSTISHWIKLIPVVDAYYYHDSENLYCGFPYSDFYQWAMLSPSGSALSRGLLGTNSLPLQGKFEHFDIMLWYSSSEISLL